MKDTIIGKVYVVSDNVDTDQIIPAAHLVYSLDDPEEKKKYGQFVFSGIPQEKQGLPSGNIPFTNDGQWRSEYNIVVAGKNFGCGSSREHAPIAMKIAGVEAVAAPFYARIFYRNVVNGGHFLPFETEEPLNQVFMTGEEAQIHIPSCQIKNLTTGKTFSLKSLGEVEVILRSGNVFEYAKQSGLVKK